MDQGAFLRLPPAIRKRILRYCLTRENMIWPPQSGRLTPSDSIPYHRPRRLHQPAYAHAHERLSVAVLRVCKTIHEESLAILYGENKFYIDVPSPTILKWLVILPNKYFAAIKRIHIYLEWSSRGVSQSKNPLLTLRAICNCLRLKASKFQLRVEYSFSLGSSRSNWDRVELIEYSLQPLAKLGSLSSLKIQILTPLLGSRLKGQQFRSLCRSYYLSLCIGASERQQTFPFTKLPMELQCQIISSASGVKPTGGFSWALMSRCSSLSGPICCGECTDVGYCWCNAEQSYSSTCTCIPSEHPLITVDKMIRDELVRQLCLENTFCISAYMPPPPLTEANNDLFKELKGAPRHLLSQVRSLRLDCYHWNNRHYQGFLANLDQTQIWVDIFTFIQSRCRLDIKLSIELVCLVHSLDKSAVANMDLETWTRPVLQAVRQKKIQAQISLAAVVRAFSTEPIPELRREVFRLDF